MVVETTAPEIPPKQLTLRERVARLRYYVNKYPALILFALFFVLLAVGLSLNQRLQNLQSTNPETSFANSLRVVSMTPEGYVYRPKTLTFTFSEPVEAALLHHYFEISHQLSGHFTQGNSKNQVVFTPTTDFPTGATVSIKIMKGLVSETGKPLLTDYFNSLKTGLADRQIQFVKDNLAGRVLSYTSQEPVKFKVNVGRDLSQLTASIYRTDQAHLFEFLTYSDKSSGDYGFDYYSDTYEVDAFPREELGEEVLTQEVTNDTEISINLTPGVYYAQATDPNSSSIGSTFILVNSKGLIFRQDDQKLTLSAFDYGRDRSVETPLPVSFYSFKDTPTLLGGIEVMENQQVAWNFKSRLDAVVGRFGGEVIFVPVYLPRSQAEILVRQNLDEVYKVFVYTDRPIYKPGDVVKFRGMARVDNDSLYTLPPTGKPVKISINNYEGGVNPFPEQTVYTDSQGTFHGELTLPQETTGLQYLYASVNPELNTAGEGSTYFDIATYTKPEYDIKTEVTQPEYFKNDTLTFIITGTYFDGRPLVDKEVDYQLYTNPYYETERAAYNTNFNITAQGGMCGGGGFNPFDEWYGSSLEDGKGKVILGKDGKAVVTYKVTKRPTNYNSYLSQKIVAVASQTDNVGNVIVGAANTIVHAAEYNIFFMPSKDTYRPDEELVVPFYGEKLTGEKLTNTEFTYNLVSSIYSEGKTSAKSEKTGTVTTDGAGRGIVKFVFPGATSGSMSLTVEKVDSKGNVSTTVKNLSITSETYERDNWWGRVSQTYLKVTASQNSFQVGDTINLSVVSPKELDVYLSLERGRIYKPQRLHLAQGENQVAIPVDDLLSPSVSVMFSFFADNQYHTEGVVLNVPAMHKLLNVEVTTDKPKYAPTETAQITVSTKDTEGLPIAARLSLAVVDKAIFALRKNATPPVHSSFYYFRPRTTNASSSLTSVGDDMSGGRGGGGGGGDSAASKLVDTLYWNPNLATDNTGTVTVPVPLQGITTTWKVQAIGSTFDTLVGQDDTEFLASP